MNVLIKMFKNECVCTKTDIHTHALNIYNVNVLLLYLLNTMK